MDIRPIKTDADYEAALAEIETLLDAGPDTPAGDRLLVLTALVQAYEEEHYVIPAPDPVSAISYYLESRGLSPEDLAPYMGDFSQVSAVLERRRPLTLEMIRRLHAGLDISADILIQDYGTVGYAA